MILTLLTDFGTRDGYVAEMKAAILSIAPKATLVDVTHEIPLGNVAAAQYVFGRLWMRFPKGTVHLAVVDPGVGTARKALAGANSGRYFVGPDNGLFTPALDGAQLVEVPIPADAAPTFHGRDVFAPAAARLAHREPLKSLGPVFTAPHRLPLPAARREKDGVSGVVVYVDRFGTLISNIEGEGLPKGKAVSIADRTIPLARTFGDVESGGLVAFVGSGGSVEIAVRDGSAREFLGLGVGEPVTVRVLKHSP